MSDFNAVNIHTPVVDMNLTHPCPCFVAVEQQRCVLITGPDHVQREVTYRWHTSMDGARGASNRVSNSNFPASPSL